MKPKYWIEVKRYVIGCKWVWCWQIKCCNGRVKCTSHTIYHKKSLCLNDASSIAKFLCMEVRIS